MIDLYPSDKLNIPNILIVTYVKIYLFIYVKLLCYCLLYYSIKFIIVENKLILGFTIMFTFQSTVFVSEISEYVPLVKLWDTSHICCCATNLR